jgi:beta-galactosidase
MCVTAAAVPACASVGDEAEREIYSGPRAEVDGGTGAPPASGPGEDGVVGTFPKGFAFGTAIAGFQVEMGCPTLPAAACEDRNSDWFQYITTPRILDNRLLHMSKDPPSTGPGFFETYKEDIARAGGTDEGELGSDVLRMSVEWSRLFPRPTFGVTGHADLKKLADADALRFYHDVFKELRSRGMRPSVTVNHYSLPLWIHDANMCNEGRVPGAGLARCITAGKAGWAHPNRERIVGEIAKYAGFLAAEFGDEVDEWATLNEPFSAVVVAGYLISSEMRSNPPGLTHAWMHVDGAKTAYLAMIEAHARIYDAIKANDKVDADGDGDNAQVGVVYAFTNIKPLTDNDADRKAAANAEYFFHDMMLDGFALGKVDENWDKAPDARTVRADLANRLDWIGVNYYFGFEAQSTRVTTLPFISPHVNFNILREFDGDAPGGLYEVLAHVKRYGKPMIVTETGFVQDDARKAAAWTVRTLEETRRAIDDGIDVRGYYAWTLMDNYEWNHGAGMRMGLYSVDPSTKARSIRESGRAFAEMAKSRDIPTELSAKYAGVFDR